ncbi:class I SAM-dependent methyltransferase, partial [Brachyspira hyodysenteriae]
MISKRECPLCGNKEVEKIFTINYSNNKEINGLPNNHDIVFCDNCSLVYNDFISNEEEFIKYYSLNSSYNESYHIVHLKNDSYNNEILNSLEKHINKNSYILEEGCGSGDLLYNFYINGYSNLYGIDASNAFNAIKNISNINFISGSIFNRIIEYKSKFDMIIISHVLEHLLDIDEIIKNIKYMLNDSGYLYISVPSLMEYSSNFKTPFFSFSLEHISHFCEQSINNLANKYSFEIVNISNSFNKAGIMELRVLLKNTNLANINFNTEDNDTIKKYIKNYFNTAKTNMNSIINDIIHKNEKVIIWGIGATTLSLFSLGLEKLNIINIIDNSPKKQGKYINGIKIISPQEINDEEATILILPELYYDSIYNQIKEMGLKNKVKF